MRCRLIALGRIELQGRLEFFDGFLYIALAQTSQCDQAMPDDLTRFVFRFFRHRQEPIAGCCGERAVASTDRVTELAEQECKDQGAGRPLLAKLQSSLAAFQKLLGGRTCRCREWPDQRRLQANLEGVAIL